jgi:hypothetical protein
LLEATNDLQLATFGDWQVMDLKICFRMEIPLTPTIPTLHFGGICEANRVENSYQLSD